MSETERHKRIEAVRQFNRFYTRQIGVLREHILRSPFSLAEARLIYELAHHEQSTATELAAELALDAGYLSRLVRSFRKRGLIARTRSADDGRQMFLRLTERGQQAFTRLNSASASEIEAVLRTRSAEDQKRLVGAMQTIERLLGAQPEHKVPYILRPPQPGDLGWVVHRHGVLYAQEYGWDEQFEALIAEIVGRFVKEYDGKRERCWIAERNGECVGCVFVLKASAGVAQLRLLLVEPSARGLGIGSRLVSECVRFARQVGYARLMLWTNDVLHAARHIYEQAGFVMVHEQSHQSFGQDLMGQTWELSL